jgi:hypothetical protein
LDGLENITSDMTLFRADNNIALFDFCSLVRPFGIIELDFYSVYDNAYNPTQQDIIDGNCSE